MLKDKQIFGGKTFRLRPVGDHLSLGCQSARLEGFSPIGLSARQSLGTLPTPTSVHWRAMVDRPKDLRAGVFFVDRVSFAARFEDVFLPGLRFEAAFARAFDFNTRVTVRAASSMGAFS